MPEQKGTIHFKNVLTVVSVIVLVGTEVLGTALAAGWAIAGLFELGDQIGHVLMALFSALGIYMMVKFTKRVLAIEPVRY